MHSVTNKIIMLSGLAECHCADCHGATKTTLCRKTFSQMTPKSTAQKLSLIRAVNNLQESVLLSVILINVLAPKFEPTIFFANYNFSIL
jgi:hypothetical protein